MKGYRWYTLFHGILGLLSLLVLLIDFNDRKPLILCSSHWTLACPVLPEWRGSCVKNHPTTEDYQMCRVTLFQYVDCLCFHVLLLVLRGQTCTTDPAPWTSKGCAAALEQCVCFCCNSAHTHTHTSLESACMSAWLPGTTGASETAQNLNIYGPFPALSAFVSFS